MADESATPTAPAETPGAPAIAPEAPSGPDWRAGLPPELSSAKSLERYQNVGDLAKAYLEVERKMGAPVEAPGPDAKPEQVAAFRKRMGLPESPDKYELDLPKPAEGTDFQWDPRWVGRLKERAHAAHMSPKQVKAMADLYHEYMHAMHDTLRGRQAQEEGAEREEAIKLLEQQWGPRHGPEWRHHNARAVAVLEHIMGDAAPAERNAIVEIAANPHFAAGLSRLADGLLERGFISGDEVPQVDLAGAQAKIDALWAAADKDPQHPLKNPLHPQHARVWDEWMKLNGMVAGPGAWKPIPGMVRR